MAFKTPKTQVVEHEPIYSGAKLSPFDPETHPQVDTRRKSRCLYISLAILITIIVLAIALGVGLGVGLSQARHHRSTAATSTASAAATFTQPAINTTNVDGAAPTAAIWQPVAGTQWQIDISDSPMTNTSLSVPIYDIDLFGNNADIVAALQKQGRKVICYFSAGSYEDWRPDASKFDKSTDLGSPLEGWQGEWWVNTNSANVRGIMEKRLDLAKSNGCDGVDPDNIDAYENNGGGLSLTTDDAISYVNYLAGEAHQRGLAMGLKNGGGDGGILSSVVGNLQFSVNEQCVQNTECDSYQAFIQQGKPVLHIEYPDAAPNIEAGEIAQDCSGSGSGAATGFSSVLKKMALDSWTIECPK